MTDFDGWLAFVQSQLAMGLPSPTRQRHPGIRLGSGRAGRPSKVELASFRRFLAQLDFETLVRIGYCECGTPLASHPPLGKQRRASLPKRRPNGST